MSFSQTREVIAYLRKRKSAILITGIIAAGLYVFSLLFFQKKYESSALVYNSNKNRTALNDVPGYTSLHELNEGYTIINWVYSSQLIDHLITKFNLYVHYGIDPKVNDAYTRCFNSISRSISVNVTPFGALKISVRDRDRLVAADMANEIVLQADRLNKERSLENRRHAIREYDFLLNEIGSNVDMQHDSLKSMLASLLAITPEIRSGSAKSQEAISSLAAVAKDYEKLSAEWLTLKKVHLLSLKDLEEHNLPNFVIIQNALPELPAPLISVSSVGTAILCFIAGAWLAVIALLLHFRFGGYVSLLFSSDIAPETTSRIYPLNDRAFTAKEDLTEPAGQAGRIPNS